MLVIALFMRQILNSIIDVRMRLILRWHRSNEVFQFSRLLPALWSRFFFNALLAVDVVTTFVFGLHFT